MYFDQYWCTAGSLPLVFILYHKTEYLSKSILDKGEQFRLISEGYLPPSASEAFFPAIIGLNRPFCQNHSSRTIPSSLAHPTMVL